MPDASLVFCTTFFGERVAAGSGGDGSGGGGRRSGGSGGLTADDAETFAGSFRAQVEGTSQCRPPHPSVGWMSTLLTRCIYRWPDSPNRAPLTDEPTPPACLPAWLAACLAAWLPACLPAFECHPWMDAMDGWMLWMSWMDGWMDGWMDECPQTYFGGSLL